jgi:PKD repeat protein
VLLAKVLRITAEGGIPPDNPFLGPDSARCNRTGRTDPGKTCQETFAWGLRNPFRLAFDPNAEGIRLFVNDVGQDHFEEINEVKAGADYGWNVREGPCAVLFSPDRTKDPVCDPHPADMTDPVYAYRHTEPTGCQTITGGAFVPEGIWPPAYDGAYLFGDFLCGKIFQLTPKAGGGFERSEFLSDLGPASVIYLTFGPHHATQSLYYTTYTNGGEVRRVDYVGGQNRPPTAAVVAEPAFGPPALTVTFDGSASRDPDRADRLAYSWDFGDGTPVGWSTQARTAHTYEKVGRYTATLRVRDGREGVSQAATTVVAVGDSPPVPRIEGPAVGHLFSVDEPITLMGAAADAEEGVLPSGQLTWTVILHHAGRSHPYLGPVTSSPVMFIAPAPTSLAAARDSYLELRLTATDSAGLTATVTQDLRPRLVEIALQAEPRGLDLIADGVTFTAPETFVSWQGYPLPIWAPDQERSGRRYAFVAWGDHPTPTRTIVTPPVPSAYTAYFLPAD